MAEFVLKNNYFQFNGKVKQQTSGTAIGTKFAATYACVFMDQVKSHPYAFAILTIFFSYEFMERMGLKACCKKLNQFHSNLNFSYESSKKEIAFLDSEVNLFENKQTDTHQYLDYTSSHPDHTKKSIVYSQTLDVFASDVFLKQTLLNVRMK